MFQQSVLKALMFAVAAIIVASSAAQGGNIPASGIFAIAEHMTGSGNGTLDVRMFTHSGSEIQNAAGMFNGDNGNNTLPNSGGADNASFVESYVTTAGDLKTFYTLNFSPPNSINEIVLFLDLNETGGGMPNNSLDKLEIVLNPTSIQGNPNPLGDVTSGEQGAIDQIYTGGTIIASLASASGVNLPVISQGAGFADYAILTGVNPFSLDDNDVLLLNVSMSRLSNGAEEIFLSGTYSSINIRPVPEPSLVALLVGGVLVCLVGAYRRR